MSVNHVLNITSISEITIKTLYIWTDATFSIPKQITMSFCQSQNRMASMQNNNYRDRRIKIRNRENTRTVNIIYIYVYTSIREFIKVRLFQIQTQRLNNLLPRRIISMLCCIFIYLTILCLYNNVQYILYTHTRAHAHTYIHKCARVRSCTHAYENNFFATCTADQDGRITI